MRPLKPQTRFLLRASVLLAGWLSLWWFALVNPMLAVLKEGAGAFLTMTENANGSWSVRVPVYAILPASPGLPAQQVNWIDFDLPRMDVIAFTFSLPVLWAILMAAPGLARSIGPLLSGTAILSAIELAMVYGYAKISAWNAVVALGTPDSGVSKWARKVGEYVIVAVIPYVSPFVLAVCVHRQLRQELFRPNRPQAGDTSAVPQSSSTGRSRPAHPLRERTSGR
jgi:hypothetical protein